MSNKIELKKAMVISLIVFLVFSIMFFFISYYQYKKYTLTFNEKLDSIIANIQDKYPKVNINDIAGILNSSDLDISNVLLSYGIDLDKDSLILENDTNFKLFLCLNIGVFFTLFISLSIVFLRYNYSKDKKIKEITRYIEEINRRNYKLNIDDNTEDELSILKNEVYKTTVMLKEVAENSTRDKINLKDSLSDISHQIKTPLTSITIMLDNILDNKDMKEEIREDFIKDIKREIANLNFLVGSILKLSKFDANTINFINKEENIIDILEAAIKNVAGLCDLKNISINIVGKEDESIFCDFRWQVEAITNILKNCVEHSYQDSKIDINYTKNRLYTKIEIRDYGIGIDEKDLSHVFERFYKGKDSSEDSVRHRIGTC